MHPHTESVSLADLYIRLLLPLIRCRFDGRIPFLLLPLVNVPFCLHFHPPFARPSGKNFLPLLSHQRQLQQSHTICRAGWVEYENLWVFFYIQISEKYLKGRLIVGESRGTGGRGIPCTL